MTDPVKQQLRDAYALIKAKKRQEAMAILLSVLKADEDNADAWWLLANCLDDPHDAREALDSVLRLRPGHEKAQTMLNAINARYPRQAPAPEPEPEEDDFGFGDSASIPFTGAAFTAVEDGVATPFEGYSEADEDMGAGMFPDAEDPFAVDTPASPFTTESFAAVTDEDDPFALGGAAEDQPFGTAELFGGPAEPFGGPAESFDGPVEPFGERSEAPAGGRRDTGPDPFGDMASDADPFGDPFGQPVAPAPRKRPTTSKPAQRKEKSTRAKDPFGAGEPARTSTRRTSRSTAKSQSGGTNPIVLLLAIIGAISIVGCIGCGIISLAAPAIFTNISGQVMRQLDSEGFVATIEAVGGNIEMQSGSNIGNAVNRGSLSYGDSRRDTLAAGEQHAWTFSGSAGDNVVIEMQAATADGLDAYLSLFNASGSEIAYDDDSGSEYNARLEYTLSASGTYTFVARTFGFSGGAYQVTLNRR